MYASLWYSLAACSNLTMLETVLKFSVGAFSLKPYKR